ncbi:TPA: hypothetical protein ACRZS6_000894 [Acinetobacter baumannii]|uniref:hypothetical protein n=1 Tax=Acinetobacter baumannii TaxID=470 RepID=UPI0005EBC6A4|nr:hypothetical protein [Acinetobacter baumannii]MDV4252168.1 hypothetical protein [Acinetobacter baumannii]
MISDTKRLDFLIENRLKVEKWYRGPSNVVFHVIDEDDECLAQDHDSRVAIDKAMDSHLKT